MVENHQSDILVVGNGLSASVLAYFISLNCKEDSVSLILRDKNIEEMLFIPSFIYPVFQLPNNQMEKIFKETTELLSDIHSISGQFELSNNPLILLYRGKKTIEEMKSHRIKLENSSIRHNNLSIEDISSYYPFITNQEEIYLTEIFDSLTCSNLDDLKLIFRKLGSENGVSIHNETGDVKLYREDTLIKSKRSNHEVNKLIIITSPLHSDSSFFSEVEMFDITTPVFERFPRVSLMDIRTQSYMWIEKAGYFHIFRSLGLKEKMNDIRTVKSDFTNIFPNLGELEIIDSTKIRINQFKNVRDSIGRIEESKVCFFSIPHQLELSLIPSVARIFSQMISKDKINEIQRFSLERIIESG